MIIISVTCNVRLLGQPGSYNLIGAYLGQAKPTLKPKVFAPGIVSKAHEYEFGSVFSPDSSEFYYGVDVSGNTEIRYMIRSDNKWSKPIRADLSRGFSCNDPFLSYDASKLFFISDMPIDGSIFKKDIDIWYVERKKGGWSEPINAGNVINSNKNEYYMSFTKDGTIYFASNRGNTDTTQWNYDIYYSKLKEGEYQKPIKLDDNINTNGYEADVFIAPDESYIIFSSYRGDGFGLCDLYVSFKEDNGWSKAVNMGFDINTATDELCPFVTNDGKYLFYTSNKDIYWVDAAIIESIRN